MYYVKFRIWVTSELCYSLEYNVDALNVKWKDHLSKETRMTRKRKASVKVLLKVKLVLVNIRFRLDISMPVMVTNPSIGFGAWQVSHVLNIMIQTMPFHRLLNTKCAFGSKLSPLNQMTAFLRLQNGTVSALSHWFQVKKLCCCFPW